MFPLTHCHPNAPNAHLLWLLSLCCNSTNWLLLLSVAQMTFSIVSIVFCLNQHAYTYARQSGDACLWNAKCRGKCEMSVLWPNSRRLQGCEMCFLKCHSVTVEPQNHEVKIYGHFLAGSASWILIGRNFWKMSGVIFFIRSWHSL